MKFLSTFSKVIHLLYEPRKLGWSQMDGGGVYMCDVLIIGQSIIKGSGRCLSIITLQKYTAFTLMPESIIQVLHNVHVHKLLSII